MNLSLSDIKVRLPGRTAPLFSITSLEIPAGSRILVHGPSGRGKTTLLHLLAGQFLPDQGTVRVGNAELSSMDDDARSRLRRAHFGIVFQRLNLLDHLTSLENVLVDSVNQARDTYPKAVVALTRMGLNPHSDQRSGTLSVGEQQRVAVARVLAATPDIILADEPTSSLDDANTDKVMTALGEAAMGKTLFVVSHDARIRNYFDTVWDFEKLVDA